MIYIKPKMIKCDEQKIVAIIGVRKSSKPVYVDFQDTKGGSRMEFYIRATKTTYTLNPKQTNDYIRERWKVS